MNYLLKSLILLFCFSFFISCSDDDSNNNEPSPQESLIGTWTLSQEFDGEEVNIRDMTGNRTLVRFGTGDEISVQTGHEGIRFLLVSGRPLKEPVAWHGPIVMNTRAEIMQAMKELNNGTFIRSER